MSKRPATKPTRVKKRYRLSTFAKTFFPANDPLVIGSMWSGGAGNPTNQPCAPTAAAAAAAAPFCSSASAASATSATSVARAAPPQSETDAAATTALNEQEVRHLFCLL